MKEAIAKLIEAANADFERFMPRERNEQMNEDFVNGWKVEEGRKYLRLVNRNTVWGFIVNVENDAKFRMGDILMAAGWKAPARNGARGNIIDGGYDIRWTGPLYFA